MVRTDAVATDQVVLRGDGALEDQCHEFRAFPWSFRFRLTSRLTSAA